MKITRANIITANAVFLMVTGILTMTKTFKTVIDRKHTNLEEQAIASYSGVTSGSSSGSSFGHSISYSDDSKTEMAADTPAAKAKWIARPMTEDFHFILSALSIGIAAFIPPFIPAAGAIMISVAAGLTAIVGIITAHRV